MTTPPLTRTYFRTAEGTPVPAVSTAEMREIDRVAVEQTGPALLQMMEHAGMNLAMSAIDMLGAGWHRGHVLVLAGPGGNGGGGVCAARHLANRGVEVTVVTSRRPAEADGALAQQLMALGETPSRLLTYAEAFDVADFDLVIDAVLGYGVTGAPRGPVMGLIRAASAAARVLSLDVPSGIDADTGDAEGFAVSPERTLALALPKTGLQPNNAGDLWLADLGIPLGVYARAGVVPPPLFGDRTRIRLDYPEDGTEASRSER